MRNVTDDLRVFSGRANPALTEEICQYLEIRPGRVHAETFPDGELFVKLHEDVRGRDVFVVQPTCRPVNDNLLELLVFIDCLRRASAKRITAVLPYFGYARQDRKDEGRVPITAKLVSNLITESGADRVLTMDLHAAQIQGFFDIPVDHLEGSPAFTRHFSALEPKNTVLVSPDVGNVKRARTYAERMGCELAIIDKRRISGSAAVVNHIIGNVEGKDVLMIDDMIATAGTLCEAAKVVKERGAKTVRGAATHPVFAGPAFERLAGAPFTEIVVANTIPMCSDARKQLPNLTVLSVADILGEAIARIHTHQSVSSLFVKA
ncbi:MAG: ribose-phosphate pyrophosphokinase [Phycisphaerales bacterium]|nr:ribose-phosphate pyrophosphokinase [Phycisphaerales bacterium]MCB9856835.1 ribose-phosphate pyrophosphokinase [Phycisphaerales bacterium]MCB9862038.1 ribose-phosphate pyrophosphokinase [Phycisphaerales bacterium]